jgi:hypothetical protein
MTALGANVPLSLGNETRGTFLTFEYGKITSGNGDIALSTSSGDALYLNRLSNYTLFYTQSMYFKRSDGAASRVIMNFWDGSAYRQFLDAGFGNGVTFGGPDVTVTVQSVNGYPVREKSTMTFYNSRSASDAGPAVWYYTGNVNFWRDETANTFKISYKDTSGTVRTVTLTPDP